MRERGCWYEGRSFKKESVICRKEDNEREKGENYKFIGREKIKIGIYIYIYIYIYI